MKFSKKILWTLIVFVTILLVIGFKAFDVFYGPNEFAGSAGKPFTISRGQTFASVVDSLQAQGLIRSREWFVFVSKTLGGAERVQVGRYKFASGVSNADLFTSLRDGRGIVLIAVTIPEGLRSQQQARIFARSLGIDSARFVSLAYNPEFVKEMGFSVHSLEGYLFPQTYSFYWQPDERDVIKNMVQQFKQVYSESLQAKAKSFGWTTNQVMTFASIVQGESKLPEEMDMIAGVYHNRLRKGMKLQADPTIQFFIEGSPRRVLYSDLKMASPYNTYLNKGLPPGPVNNPGEAAIVAALSPKRHTYLFFVANGNGGHQFTATYADHMRFVRQYRKLRGRLQSEAFTRAENNKGLKQN